MSNPDITQPTMLNGSEHVVDPRNAALLTQQNCGLIARQTIRVTGIDYLGYLDQPIWTDHGKIFPKISRKNGSTY